MKKVIAVLVVVCICLCFVPTQKARADVITGTVVAGAAYAIMQSWGINFTSSVASAAGMSDFMSTEAAAYAQSQGSDIATVFAGQIAVDVAGHLVVGQTIYNAIVDFADYLIDKYSLSTVEKIVTMKGMNVLGDPSMSGVYYVLTAGSYYTMHIYDQGVEKARNSTQYPVDQYRVGETTINAVPITPPTYNFVATQVFIANWGSYTKNVQFPFISQGDRLDMSLSSDYVDPDYIDPSQEWIGTIGGASVPDTNLDDLIDDIFDNVVDNNLVVDGDVTEPQPVPTPAPTWEPVSDVIDGINSLGEEVTSLGNDIGNIADGLDDLGNVVGGFDDAIADQTGALGDAISDQTDSLTDSIDSVTDAVESMADSIADALDVPAASDISNRKWSLSTLFPFCIPFDIYNMLRAFDGVAQAPHVQLPFNIQSIGFSYMIDLDFSAFSSVAAVLRQVELIVYGIALAYATSKVIRW